MYFLEMAHLGEKRSWLSAEEVLEELDEPIMPDSDDDLEDLQMDETDDDERCTIESVFQELSPLFNPDCPPSDSQDCPTPSLSLSGDAVSFLSLPPTQGNDYATDLAVVHHSPTHSLSSLEGTITAGAHAASTHSLITPPMLPQLTLAPCLEPAVVCSPPTHSHSPSSGSDPAVHHHAIVGSPTPSPAPTHSLPSSKEKWTKNFEPVDVSPFIQDVGPTFDVESSPKSVFQHFFTAAIISHITIQTNLYASQVLGEERYQQWEQVTEEELMAYLGFAILMGVVKLPAINDYWRLDPYLHYAPISDRISRDRFRDIHRFLHFADNTSLPLRGEPGHDRLGKVRPVLTALLEQFLTSFNPHCEQVIDEAMIPFQGRSSLKQYMPAKPIKRGIKAWCRADAHNGYLCEFRIYMGRTESDVSDSGETLGERVVCDLTRRLDGLHYHIYFDNYFTSVSLLTRLKSKGLYGCGTIRQTSKGFPEALRMKGKGKRAQQQLKLAKRYANMSVVPMNIFL